MSWESTLTGDRFPRVPRAAESLPNCPIVTSEKFEHTVSSPTPPRLPPKSSSPMNSKSLILPGDPSLPGGDEKKGDDAAELCESFDILAGNGIFDGDEGVLDALLKPDDDGILD